MWSFRLLVVFVSMSASSSCEEMSYSSRIHPIKSMPSAIRVDPLKGFEMTNDDITEQCRDHFQDFLNKLKKPQYLYLPEARWALKSKEESTLSIVNLFLHNDHCLDSVNAG